MSSSEKGIHSKYQKFLKLLKLPENKNGTISDMEAFQSNKQQYLDKDYCYSFLKKVSDSEAQLKQIILSLFTSDPRGLLTIMRKIKEIYQSKIQTIANLQLTIPRVLDLAACSLD